MGVRRFLQTLCDPEAVQKCIATGIDCKVTLEVGGKTDDLHGAPVEVTGWIRRISTGKYEDPNPTHGGFRYFDSGPTVVFETVDDHTLVLTSHRVGNTSREQMYSVGVYPEHFGVIVAKGVVSPRPAYQEIASEIILVNTPGATSANLSSFIYQHRRVPLYPFEKEAEYNQTK